MTIERQVYEEADARYESEMRRRIAEREAQTRRERERQEQQVTAAAREVEKKVSHLLEGAARDLNESRREFDELMAALKQLCRNLESSERAIFEAVALARSLPNVTVGVEMRREAAEFYKSQRLGMNAFEDAMKGLNLNALPASAENDPLSRRLSELLQEVLLAQGQIRLFIPRDWKRNFLT